MKLLHTYMLAVQLKISANGGMIKDLCSYHRDGQARTVGPEMVAGSGFEPLCEAYETSELPLLYPAIKTCRRATITLIPKIALAKAKEQSM